VGRRPLMKLSLRVRHRPAADPPWDETVIASSTPATGRPALGETVITRSVSDAAIPRIGGPGARLLRRCASRNVRWPSPVQFPVRSVSDEANSRKGTLIGLAASLTLLVMTVFSHHAVPGSTRVAFGRCCGSTSETPSHDRRTVAGRRASQPSAPCPTTPDGRLYRVRFPAACGTGRASPSPRGNRTGRWCSSPARPVPRWYSRR
jgi:hypothetical protein